MNTKILLASLSALVLFGGCGDVVDAVIDDLFDKDYVKIENLAYPVVHAIEYKNRDNGHNYTYIYCADGVLRDALAPVGTWRVSGNNVIHTVGMEHIYETDGMFRKYHEYNVSRYDYKVKVLRISESSCM